MEYPKVGVCSIIIRNNRVLFGKRKGDHGGGTWAPPGGKVEFNEDPKDTAVREALEETGLEVNSPRFVAMTNDIFRETKRHYITLYFICQYVSGEPKVMEPEKCERWEWFDWDNLPSPLFITIQNLLKQNFNPIIEE
jgi:8-oxo-dGTP diphosphatase